MGKDGVPAAAVVSVKQVINVKPERNGERYALFLSNIDQRFGYYVRNLLFYSESPGLDALVERMKASMSKILVAYSCWAGRLQSNPVNKRLEVDCDNQGALLVGAVSPLSESEVSEELFEKFFFEPPEDVKSLEDLPLLIIQVTQLEGSSGCAFAMLQHHTVGEATTAIYFLRNLAAQCLGRELLFVPNHDRTVLKARDPPQPMVEHLEFGKQGPDSRYTVTPDSVLKAESLRKKVAATSTKIRKKYKLSSDWLWCLKQSVLQDITCSTFDVLAAKVWKSHTHVFHDAQTGDKKRTVGLRFLVDTRRILRLGPESSGNFVYVPSIRTDVEKLLEEPLSETVKRIQQAKEMITKEYVMSGMDFLELNPDYWYHPECDTVINAWPKVMSYASELDFGWGKPCRTEFPMHPGNKSIIFFPSSGNCGLELSISLEPGQFKVFEDMLFDKQRAYAA